MSSHLSLESAAGFLLSSLIRKVSFYNILSVPANNDDDNKGNKLCWCADARRLAGLTYNLKSQHCLLASQTNYCHKTLEFLIN